MIVGVVILVWQTFIPIKEFNAIIFGFGGLCALFSTDYCIVWDVTQLPHYAKQKEDHKQYLLVIYAKYQFNYTTEADVEVNDYPPHGFYYNLYGEAIRKLNQGVEPKLVEDWLIRLEKNWDNI